jgi:hypothetical protein
MEATIELTAAQAASEALDIINNKKPRFVIGKKTVEEKKTKYFSKYFLLIFIVAFLLPFFITQQKKYKVEGSVHINGKFAKDQEINFLDKNKKLIKIKSDNSGEFKLDLAEGIYKIYLTGSGFKKYSKPETTPFSLKLSKNMEELRIYIPKLP